MKPASLPAYVLSCGIIPVFFGSEGPLFLLLRIYSYWDFPKGRMEKGESPEQTALRELEEETTLHEVDFPWGMEFRETGPYSYGKIARYYLGEVKTQQVSLPVVPELGRAEHHEYRWLNAEEVKAKLSPRVQPIFDWALSLVSSRALKAS